MTHAKLTPGGWRLLVGLGLAVALVGSVLVWIALSRTERATIAGTDPDFFAGFWPASTPDDARRLQRETDDGRHPWRKDATEVALRYADMMGWEMSRIADENDIPRPAEPSPVEIRGSPESGWTAEVALDMDQGYKGFTLVGLLGAEEPAWFVADINGYIDMYEPAPGSGITSPVRVTGSHYTSTKTVLITLSDDTGTEIARRVADTAKAEGTCCLAEYDAELSFDTPSTRGGLLQVDDWTGKKGQPGDPDDTVVRVRFGEPVPQAPRPAAADDIDAEEAFHCFVNARIARDLDGAKHCSTDGFGATITEHSFESEVDRFVIRDSARQRDLVRYTATVYWGPHDTPTGSSVDTVDVVRAGERWRVADWRRGSAEDEFGPPDQSITLWFRDPSKPPCHGDEPNEDALVGVERRLYVQDLVEGDPVMAIGHEILTGPWRHEGRLAPVFEPPARLEANAGAPGKELLVVRDRPPVSGCDLGRTAVEKTIRGLGTYGTYSKDTVSIIDRPALPVTSVHG